MEHEPTNAMITQVKNLIRRSVVDRDQPMVFTLSTGRTGSTTLTRILALSESFLSVHEPRPYLWDVNKWVYDNDKYGDPQILNRFLEGRWRLMRSAKKEAKIYADASNYLSFLAPALHELFPKAKFVFLHRCPEEIVYSGMRRGWYKTHGFDRHRIVPKPGTEAAALWNRWSRFEKICWLWAEYNQTCIDCFKQLDPERRLELPSAELWGNPEHSLRRLFAFLRIPVTNLDPFVTLLKTPVNAQTGGKGAPPERWSQDERAQLARLTGPVADKLGYTAIPSFASA